jgi:ASC-1-like (ASCH) protein
MMHHELKLKSCFFEPAEAGLKTFEIRRNSDRGFQAGDTVEFREVGHLNLYTHRELHARITYVLNYEQKEDYVVFAFVLIDKP